jgi:hypothetical protein
VENLRFVQDPQNMRFRSLVISLPVLLCVAQATKPFSLAEAAGMDATAATGLLAKSQTIDVKCAVLNKEKSQTLRDFVARAEISLAEKASVAVARKTIAGGRAEGKAAVCDAAASKLVNDVLAAASAATAAPIEDSTSKVPVQPIAAAPVQASPAPPAKAIAVVKPAPVLKKAIALVKPQNPKTNVVTVMAEKPAKSQMSKKLSKPAEGLGTYAAVAEKYYVATRCGSMSASGIAKLYKAVLSNHQQALANNRPVAVRAMLRSAEARAGSKSCG